MKYPSMRYEFKTPDESVICSAHTENMHVMQTTEREDISTWIAFNFFFFFNFLDITS